MPFSQGGFYPPGSLAFAGLMASSLYLPHRSFGKLIPIFPVFTGLVSDTLAYWLRSSPIGEVAHGVVLGLPGAVYRFGVSCMRKDITHICTYVSNYPHLTLDTRPFRPRIVTICRRKWGRFPH